MTVQQRPLMVDVFPDLIAAIVRLLRAANLDDPLAETIERMSFYGPCVCSSTCTSLLTAPFGSSGSWLVQLEEEGEDVVWLSLDPSATAVTDIEVIGGRAHQPASRGRR